MLPGSAEVIVFDAWDTQRSWTAAATPAPWRALTAVLVNSMWFSRVSDLTARERDVLTLVEATVIDQEAHSHWRTQ